MQTSPNDIKPHRVVLRGLGAMGLAAAPVHVLWGVCSRTLEAVGRGAPVRPAEALAAALAAAASALLCWLVLLVLLALLAGVPGVVGRGTRRLGGAVGPPVLRHAVAGLLGVVVVAGAVPGSATAAPVAAVAAPAPPPEPGFTPLPDPGWAPLGPAATRATSGWVPEPPVVRAQPDVRVLSPAPRSGAGSESAHEVVVRRGDSLWSIAARHLGRDASDAEIARAWPAWFAANRAVIGDDPDLLRPGQLLRAPGVVSS